MPCKHASTPFGRFATSTVQRDTQPGRPSDRVGRTSLTMARQYQRRGADIEVTALCLSQFHFDLAAAAFPHPAFCLSLSHRSV
jgi:hypothetical protein